MANYIIKYSGDIEVIRTLADEVTVLLENYAIVDIAIENYEAFSMLNEVIYIEEPNLIYENISNVINENCIGNVQRGEKLFGEGVIIAVIDSGINFDSSVFDDVNGITRIIYYWDQTDENGIPPIGYGIGSLYDKEEITIIRESLSDADRFRLWQNQHGTAVASIAAGNFSEDKSRNLGIATKSDIIGVKLGNVNNDGPRTSELMQAIDFCLRKSIELRKPLVINISFGNSYGPHDGTSLIERYIDDVSGITKSTIVVGIGNEGLTNRHFQSILSDETVDADIAVGTFERNLKISFWIEYSEYIGISLVLPSGKKVKIFNLQNNSEVEIDNNIVTDFNNTITNRVEVVVDGMRIVAFYRMPTPFSVMTEIFIGIYSRNEELIESGIYQLKIEPVNIKKGEINGWIVSDNITAGFLLPSANKTLTLPSTASSVISVGAYDSALGSVAAFSGRGFVYGNNVKPDIIASGVNIVAAYRDETALFTGTSFATPVVAGSVALLKEWGIVRGNDSNLYGEKVRAYLRRGARPIDGQLLIPDDKVGFGLLCLSDVLNK